MTPSSQALSQVPSEVLARTAPLYERVKRVIPPPEWPAFAGDIDATLSLTSTRTFRTLLLNPGTVTLTW